MIDEEHFTTGLIRVNVLGKWDRIRHEDRTGLRTQGSPRTQGPDSGLSSPIRSVLL